MHVIGDLYLILTSRQIISVVLVVAVLIATGRAMGLHRIVVPDRIVWLILSALGTGLLLFRTFLR